MMTFLGRRKGRKTLEDIGGSWVIHISSMENGNDMVDTVDTQAFPQTRKVFRHTCSSSKKHLSLVPWSHAPSRTVQFCLSIFAFCWTYSKILSMHLFTYIFIVKILPLIPKWLSPPTARSCTAKTKSLEQVKCWERWRGLIMRVVALGYVVIWHPKDEHEWLTWTNCQ